MGTFRANSLSVQLSEKFSNSFIEVMSSEKYPKEIRTGINDVISIINKNITLPELYSNELQEIPVSSSMFQDMCVQMLDHFTPHRKYKQVMLELGNKLDALDSSKNAIKKLKVKLYKLNTELQEIQTAINLIDSENDLSPRKIDENIYYMISNYIPKMGWDDAVINKIFSEGITNKYFIAKVLAQLDVSFGTRLVELEEAGRALKSNTHMVKDAALKAHQYRTQAEVYKKEIEESGLSFEEAECVYYVMYFTAEAERQLRTGDHQIDRGTFGAIGNLPESLRLKVLTNIAYLRNKLFAEEYDLNGDYLYRTNRNLFEPKKTGDMEFENMSVEDFIKIKPIKLISKDEE